MGNIADHGSSKVTKILSLGDSGSGKTGALAKPLLPRATAYG